MKSKNRKRGGNALPLKTPRIEEDSKVDDPGPRQDQKVLSTTGPSLALPPRLPLHSGQLRRRLQVLQEHSISISLLGNSPSHSHQAQVSNCCPLSPSTSVTQPSDLKPAVQSQRSVTPPTQCSPLTREHVSSPGKRGCADMSRSGGAATWDG